MPNTKSAKKRMHQNAARRERNRAGKSLLRTRLRKVDEAVEAGNVAQAESEFQAIARELDRAGQRKVIHKNKASRTKSRLQKRIKAIKQASA